MAVLNDAIFNDLERPLTPISKSYIFTLNNSETAQDTYSFNRIAILHALLKARCYF